MYDVAVLGAGPGGYVAALRAALRGAVGRSSRSTRFTAHNQLFQKGALISA